MNLPHPRSSGWLPVALLLVAACAQPEAPAVPTAASLSGMRAAADAAEAAWGVPADLTLAVAWTETRWRTPSRDHHHGAGDAAEGHAPRAIGVGGLRPWLDHAPVELATRALDVSTERIDGDPRAGILATAAVLRELALRTEGEVPPANDPAAWSETLAAYAGLEAEAGAGYAKEVLGWLRRGIRTEAEHGELVIVAPQTVRSLEPAVGAARHALSAEYAGARWVAAHSSNYSNGRGGESVQYVIIHTMQGSYAGSISWFQNSAADASAHYNIRASDGEITQMVRESDMGWHAGNGLYNRRSIGIEHEGYIADPGRWYTEAMYASSAALTRHLCEKYGIPMDRDHIIGHDEVPDPYNPGRFGGAGNHTDPGSGWDWDHFMDLVRGEPAGPDYDATLVNADHPSEMVSGERAVAWVELRNEGRRTWDLSDTLLGTTMPRDHASVFYDVENWVNDHRATPPDHSTYGPGSVGRFTFMIQAPEVTEPTTLTETFGLVQEGVTWFGPEDVTLRIRVLPAGGSGGGGEPGEDETPGDEPPVGDPPVEEPDDEPPAEDPDREPPVEDPRDPPDVGDPVEEPPVGDPIDTPPERRMDGGCSAAAGGSASGGLVAPLLLLALGRLRLRPRASQSRARCVSPRHGA